MKTLTKAEVAARRERASRPVPELGDVRTALERENRMFPRLFPNLGLPELFSMQSAGEELGIEWAQLVDLVQNKEIRAFTHRGITLFSPEQLQDFKTKRARRREWAADPEHPRFQFPHKFTPNDVLAILGNVLGEEMPRMGRIPKSTPPNEVYAMVKKAFHAERKAATDAETSVFLGDPAKAGPLNIPAWLAKRQASPKGRALAKKRARAKALEAVDRIVERFDR